MKFCNKCGSKLEKDESVCHNCGYNFYSGKYEFDDNDTQIIDTQQFIDSDNSNEGHMLLPRKKKNVILLTIIIGIIIIGSFIFIGKSLSKPSRIVARFESDILSGNKSDLSNIFYSNDNRLKIDKKNSSYLLTYFKDNPSYLNKITDNMNSQLENVNLIKEVSADSRNNFDIVVDGRILLFFPKYKINIKPTFIDVKTGIKDVELFLGDSKIGKSDTDDFSKEFGPFMPGKYKLYAEYKGKHISLNKTYNIDLVDSTNGKVSVDVFKDLNYVNIDGDYPDAEIFVNSKDTEVMIRDAENFGPVNPGMKIYAIANKNGKKLKSNEHTVVEGDSNIDLSFSDSEAQLNGIEAQLHNLVDIYTNSFCHAVNYGYFSDVEPYLYPGSNLYNEQAKYILDTYNKGINEDIMSYNVISYSISDDNKSGTVTTEEVYKITKDGQSSVKNFKYIYGFKYNENMGSYQLSSITSAK
ncbi:zinc ribbon domain-containing protein [Clostridium sp. BJN0013]|mgnify:CR=1 FL=1|uniref:zinc ribbon domain-containing protein n=1 Tax=Clostridium sp. BJN0013 TaxID=3236840 RepID=UPI0034C5CFC5